MAKAAMFDIYQTRQWKEVEKKCTKQEWENYGMKAIKKENRRSGLYGTLNEWTRYKRDRRGKKKGARSQSLTQNLIDWDIGYHYAYKYEMSKLLRWQWCIVTQLRSGHNCLNAQKKYGHDSTLCDQEVCGDLKEDLRHYVYVCMAYGQQRNTFFDALDLIYMDVYGISIDSIDYEELIQFILFPLQEDLLDKDIRRDTAARLKLLNQRITVLKLLCCYVEDTGRFKK